MELVNDNGQDDHEALDDHLPELRYAAHYHAVIDHADYKSTDNSSANGTDTASHGGAAQYGSRNGVHFPGFTGCRMGGGQLGGCDNTDHSGADAGNDVDQDFDTVDLHAGQLGCPLVAADRKYMPAKRSTLENQGEYYSQDDQDQKADGDTQQAGAEEFPPLVAEGRVALQAGLRGAV